MIWNTVVHDIFGIHCNHELYIGRFSFQAHYIWSFFFIYLYVISPHLVFLSTGSRKPNLPLDGKLRFYSMRFCPYAQRVHLVLNAKHIPHHTININLSDKPEWFLQMVPGGKVPALQLVTDNNQPFITESLIIMEYLDEKYPEHPLFPRDPTYKAIDKMWIERFAHVSSIFFQIVLDPRDAERNLTEVAEALDLYEDELRRRCTAFFGGKKPNMLDYAIWPWFERVELVKMLVGNTKFFFDRERYPTLVRHAQYGFNWMSNYNWLSFQASWYFAMMSDPAVKKCYLSEEQHAKFFETRHQEIPNYDILVWNRKSRISIWLIKIIHFFFWK